MFDSFDLEYLQCDGHSISIIYQFGNVIVQYHSALLVQRTHKRRAVRYVAEFGNISYGSFTLDLLE